MIGEGDGTNGCAVDHAALVYNSPGNVHNRFIEEIMDDHQGTLQ